MPEEIPGVGQSITSESAGTQPEMPVVAQTPAVEQRATGLKALLARVRGMFGGRSAATNAPAEMPTGIPSAPIQTEAPAPTSAPQTPGLPPTTA